MPPQAIAEDPFLLFQKPRQFRLLRSRQALESAYQAHFTHPREVAGPSKLLAINEHPQFFTEHFERPVSDVPLSLQVPLLTPSVGRGLVSADDPSHNFRCHRNWGGVAAVHYHCNEIRLSGNQDVKRDA